MDNTETLATSDTQVTEGRQRKRKNVTQKTKMMIHIPSKAWVNQETEINEKGCFPLG
jgi:hypothetical protein